MTHYVALRDVTENDLPVFFEQQADPDANRMAAFPARDHDAFTAHWAKSLGDKSVIIKTVIFDGHVAGNIVSWIQSGERDIGYWIGKADWGKGIASAALSQFLTHVTARPLYAHVAKHNIASLRVLHKCGFTISGEAKFPGADGQQGEEFILTLAAQDRSDAQ